MSGANDIGFHELCHADNFSQLNTASLTFSALRVQSFSTRPVT
jgi:hypothetical protein